MEFSKPKEFNGSEKTIKTTCISATQTLLAFYASKPLKVYVCFQMFCLVFIFHRMGPSVHADQRVEDSLCLCSPLPCNHLHMLPSSGSSYSKPSSFFLGPFSGTHWAEVLQSHGMVPIKRSKLLWAPHPGIYLTNISQSSQLSDFHV